MWDYEDVLDILGEELGDLYCAVYDITPEGNFEGASIPNLIREPIDSFAEHNDLNADDVKRDLEQARQKLFAVREERVDPHKDDKILTAWNGLMIAGLAKAGRAFNNQDAIEAAMDAIQFIEKQLIINNRVMVLDYREGEKLAGGIRR